MDEMMYVKPFYTATYIHGNVDGDDDAAAVE